MPAELLTPQIKNYDELYEKMSFMGMLVGDALPSLVFHLMGLPQEGVRTLNKK